MKTRRASLPFAILGTLAACSPAAPGVSTPGRSAPPASEQTAADTGARIYSGSCVACHQQNAQGIPGVYPSLVGSPVLLGDPAPLARWVIEGRRPPFMPAGRYPTAMPQFGWMKDRDAAALFSYLRSNFGNSAPPVSAATIAEALGNGG
jgi:mono/diheme cytochrome c family protein